MKKKNKMSAISIVKNEITEEKEIKTIKQELTLDEFYDLVKEFKMLADKIKNSKIKDYPEEDTDNLETLDFLVHEADDGEPEIQEVLRDHFDDLERRCNICYELEEEEADRQLSQHIKDVMSRATHLNPIDTKF